MTPVTFDESLAQCLLFRGLTDDERQQLRDLLQHESFSAGKTILQEGRSTQILWVVLRGHCQVVKETRNGGEQQLAVLEPGYVFGEMSFFQPAPHSASVRALDAVEVLRLDREKYDQLLHRGSTVAPKLAMNIIAVLADRLRTMDDWTCELVEKAEAGKHRDEWRDFRSKLYSEWQF